MRRARRHRIERDTKRRRPLGVNSKATLAAGAGIGATVLFAPAADAATFTVTNLNNDGAGSLRQAVIDANAAAGEDTVVFQSGLTGTITLAGTDIDVLEGLDIQGPGAGVITVNGNNASTDLLHKPRHQRQPRRPGPDLGTDAHRRQRGCRRRRGALRNPRAGGAL